MDPLVLVLVLVAAILHATWNALVKSGGDPFLRLAVTNAVCALCAAPLLPFVDAPGSRAWPYLLGSVAIHNVYYLLLAASYRSGDLSRVYPIARGSAPPLVALGGLALAGESVTPLGWLALAIISGGIVSLSGGAGRRIEERRTVALALATGLSIAAYTTVDGLGGRSSGAVFGYIAWLFVLDAVPFCLIVLVARRGGAWRSAASRLRPAALGGVLAFVGYALVIWAMSRTQMALVSAVRETSVVIAAWIGTRLLGESFGRRRVAAACIVAAGVVLLHLA